MLSYIYTIAKREHLGGWNTSESFLGSCFDCTSYYKVPGYMLHTSLEQNDYCSEEQSQVYSTLEVKHCLKTELSLRCTQTAERSIRENTFSSCTELYLIVVQFIHSRTTGNGEKLLSFISRISLFYLQLQ